MEVRPHYTDPNRAVTKIEDENELLIVEHALRLAKNIKDTLKITHLAIRTQVFRSMGRTELEYPAQISFSVPQLGRIVDSLTSEPFLFNELTQTSEEIATLLTDFLIPKSE